jgi:hypothetical protein
MMRHQNLRQQWLKRERNKVMITPNGRYDHLMSKARDAKRGGHVAWAVQSTGEKVAVALVLNRADWLAEYDYTIAEAIDRAGQEWVVIIPQIARRLAEEDA